jgi:hypothetical protein
MSTDISIENKPADVFKTFPEFSKLTLADRGKYEKLVHDFPPVADLQFYELVIHWNALDAASVSLLNGNLVLSYWMLGLEKNSGLSLIGTNDVDRTLCELFDHLRQTGQQVRLVHVPEFVVEHIQYTDMFRLKPERRFDEYILDLSKLNNMQEMKAFQLKRVQKFMARTKGMRVVVKPIDLMSKQNQELMLRCREEWKNRGVINYIVRHVNDMIEVAIQQSEAVGLHALGLYVEGELKSFVLYCKPADKRYVIISHALESSEIPYTYDYMVYAFAGWWADQGITSVNIDSDLGIPLLRAIKIALGPSNYFRKYTIEPAG